MILPEDVRHVVNMVLNDNKEQRLTEALIIGIESGVMFYCQKLNVVNKNTPTLEPEKQ